MHVAEAWLNLARAKSRALLSLAGVVLASAAVVGTLQLGASFEAQSAAQFLALQPDLWVLRAPHSVNRTTLALPRSEVLAMPAQLASVRSAVPVSAAYRMVSRTSTGHLARAPAAEAASVVALSTPLAQLLGLQIAQGRTLTRHDQNQRHVLLGAELAQRLAGTGAPVQQGEAVRLNDTLHRVVGVLKPGDFPAGLPINLNDSAFGPESAASPAGQRVEFALLQVRHDLPTEQVQHAIQDYWARRLGGALPTLERPVRLVAAMNGQQALLAAVLGSTAALAILLGGLGMANTLLVSVAQRRVEIGIRMAIGAQPVDICTLFLVEAAVLSTAGGVLGALLGSVASAVFAAAAHLPQVAVPLAWVLGPALCVATGLLAGFYPAWRASRLHPIHAMQGSDVS